MNIAEVHTAAVGLMPVSRPLLPGYDSGVLAMIVVSFLFASVGFKTAAGIWHQFFTDLSMRHRNSLTGNASERTNRERWLCGRCWHRHLCARDCCFFHGVITQG